MGSSRLSSTFHTRARGLSNFTFPSLLQLAWRVAALPFPKMRLLLLAVAGCYCSGTATASPSRPPQASLDGESAWVRWLVERADAFDSRELLAFSLTSAENAMMRNTTNTKSFVPEEEGAAARLAAASVDPAGGHELPQDVGPREELRPGGPSLGRGTTDGMFGLLKAALGTQVRGTEEMACRVE